MRIRPEVVYLVGAAWFVDQPMMWLLFGVGLLALLAAPGVVLMRQAKRAA